MPAVPNVAAPPAIAQCAGRRRAVAAGLAALLVAASPPALALDGCLVLLCLAAPSWRAIPQCVPPITTLLRDLALGRSFPSCGMAGPGNGATHRWATAPDFCPPQYVQTIEGESAPSYLCDFRGAVSVRIDGALWARTWWNMAGSTVTEFMPAAKATMGTWDTRFDDDYAAWVATLPAPPAPCPKC
jgi:hypothetical protein